MICLYGASAHGKVVKSAILTTSNQVEVFFDDNAKCDFIDEIPVLSSENIGRYKDHLLHISIGDNFIRKRISEKIKTPYVTIIHSTAIVADSVLIKEGALVMSGVIINTDVQIGKHTILNTASVIEHDCCIGNFVHVSPSATMAGNVIVGEGTHIGTGAIILPNITIGKWVTIGAGSVILKDVPNYAVVVGNPGRIIKYNKEK